MDAVLPSLFVDASLTRTLFGVGAQLGLVRQSVSAGLASGTAG